MAVAPRCVDLGEFSLAVPALELGPGLYHIKGPNGSGKTTFMRFLLGLLERTNKPAADDLIPRLRGYVPQSYREALLPWLSAKQNALLLKRGKAEALDLLMRIGFSPGDLGKRPHALSGGQAQRIVVAREVAARPALLVLDEPFSALDRETSKLVLKAMVDMRPDDATTILSTHIPVEDILPEVQVIGISVERTTDTVATLWLD